MTYNNNNIILFTRKPPTVKLFGAISQFFFCLSHPAIPLLIQYYNNIHFIAVIFYSTLIIYV